MHSFEIFVLSRVARHRREVVEPEVLAEGTDSEEEKTRRREEEESSEEEEELDDEVGQGHTR